MKLTHSEKAVLIEALDQYRPSGVKGENKIGKEIDRKNVLKQVHQIKSTPSKT